MAEGLHVRIYQNKVVEVVDSIPALLIAPPVIIIRVNAAIN